MGLMLPVIRADCEVCDTHVYRPQSPLDCTIVAFGGLQDSQVGYEQLAAWRAQTCGYFSLRMLAGDHFFIHQSRAQLLNVISRYLTQVHS
jgi:medium-chain acyl-[acyl-carrier-protein] hydrolase